MKFSLEKWKKFRRVDVLRKYFSTRILQHRSQEERTERVTAMKKFAFAATTYIKSMGGDGWRGVGVQKRAQKLFWSIRCGCEKQRNYHRTFTSKPVTGVFTVFATGSTPCEHQVWARGMAQSITCIIIILCRKYFVRLIFVALCDFENFSTTKISRFTVFCPWVKQDLTSLHNINRELISRELDPTREERVW